MKHVQKKVNPAVLEAVKLLIEAGIAMPADEWRRMMERTNDLQRREVEALEKIADVLEHFSKR